MTGPLRPVYALGTSPKGGGKGDAVGADMIRPCSVDRYRPDGRYPPLHPASSVGAAVPQRPVVRADEDIRPYA